MTVATFRRTSLFTALAVAALALAACTEKLDGKYAAPGGMATVEFKGGKAYISSPDITGGKPHTETADYTENGDTITVKSKDGDMAFTRLKDGSLEGPMGNWKKAAG